MPGGRAIRTLLDGIAIIAVLCAWSWTAYDIYGPHRLPSQIPTHFDLTGRPDAVGSPHMLWLLPAVATVIYAIMSAVARYPDAFNYPVRVTMENRRQLQATALNMIAWLKVEVVGLFACIQFAILQSVRAGKNGLPGFLLPLTLGIVFATIAAHIWAMLRLGAPRPRRG